MEMTLIRMMYLLLISVPSLWKQAFWQRLPNTVVPSLVFSRFLSQNEIHSDLLSRPLIHFQVNFSLNIFSETTTPRGLRFCRNVPLVVLYKICLYGSGILNNFHAGSEKLPKITESLKIFYSRRTKSSFIISKVLSQVCSWQLPVTYILPIMLPRVRRYEKSQFQC
jgi:hypothetical protein